MSRPRSVPQPDAGLHHPRMDDRFTPVRRIPPIIAAVFALSLVALAAGVLYGVGSAIDPRLVAIEGTPLARPSPSGPARATPPLTGQLGGDASPSASRPEPSPSTSPEPSPSPPPSPSPTPALDPPPQAGPFQMNLYRRGDFVSQTSKINCVPASMQTMMNIMDRGADRRASTQRRLYTLARRLSTDRLVGDGAEPEGWARGLTREGYGPYAVDVRGSIGAAIKTAARAIRMTRRPAGLLTWRGAHSWVMSGFKATADPAFTSDYQVTHVYIQDVWYPRVSSIWGASRAPNALVPVGRLREDYLPWRRPTARYPEKDGKFVFIMPVAEAA